MRNVVAEVVMAKARSKIRMHFLTGILLAVPLVVTILSVVWIDNSITAVLDRLFALIPDEWNPQKFVPSMVPGLGIAMTVVLIYLVGFFGSVYLGRRIVDFYELLLNTIPGVRWFYVVAKQLMEAVFRLMREFKGDSDRFRGVVLLQYPRKGIYTLAFLTGDSSAEVSEKIGVPMVNLFVPTSPNPTSGFYIMAPKEEVIPIDMRVDQAFKLILSAGMVGGDAPEEEKTRPAPSGERAGRA